MFLNNLIIPYDYILILLILLVSVFCFWKGFIQSILSLLTWIGSILITIYTYDTFANYLTSQLLNINLFQEYEYFTNILSIIISIPIILASLTLSLFDLTNNSINEVNLQQSFFAAIVACITALLSIHFMMSLIQKTNFNLFIIYRICLGFVLLVFYA